MKIVDAVWEKRNLGVDTVEITLELNDNIDEIKRKLNEVDAKYIVLKIPSYRPDLLQIAYEEKFRYMEDMVYVVNYLQEINRNPVMQRLYDAVTVDIMSTEDMEQLYQEIENGIFDSDRIYLDTYFNHQIAKTRYLNWVKDEYTRGTEFLKYVYKNESIGFFALREVEPRHYTSFLGGIYSKYRVGGIGTIVKVPEEVKLRGGKKVSTSVSTNNAIQLKSLAMNGYIPESISHTFVKHK